jgi:predicted ATPase/DNA-binding SARP family transcriptional activator
MRPEAELEFRVLGPLEVVAEGRPLNLSGIKQRALLAILLLEANRVVSAERLVELLWGEVPPETAPNVLQVYISQLRKAVEPDGVPYRVLISRPPGYLLQVGPDELDAMRFEKLLEKAADAQPEVAGAILREALALWRGTALAEFANAPFALSEAARLNELRLRALEERIQADLELGQHRTLVGELEAVVGEHPLRERFCGQLMLALYRSGRQAEASDVYQRTRLRLVDELGMEPGRDLEQLLKRILNHDRALDLEPRTRSTSQRSLLQPSGSESAHRLSTAGTLTFLMTDIEGSTKLWDASPVSAKLALERHDRIVLDQVEKNQGEIVESGREGDSVLAVFRQASDGVACALDIQRSFQREDWPAGVDMRVRIALHSGEAERRSGHYVGAPLYRCARLMATANGGQILISRATEELASDALPEGVSLRDLGLHRLRDISRPEQVYQLLHPDLQSEFPALMSMEPPQNLPIQLTSFIGRQRELEELKLALAANRLVTLTGAGGCGKTRLALQTAAVMQHEYPDGAYFVDLSRITDQSLIAACTAAALALREKSGLSLEASVLEHLARRKLLLVMDNCEHVLEGCTTLTGRMLAGAPELRVLATSQQPLNVPGEVRWRVPSLGLPPSAGEGRGPDSVVGSEAVQLFVERARLARPGFALDNKSGPAVAQICRRLDGIPLAIELAAAQIAVLTPNDIVARLDDRFRLLGTGKRKGTPRQQTLLAAVTWSHDLLDDGQKILFRRLSVFSGSFDLDAAEAVGAGGSVEVADVLDVLTGLIEKSLVVAGEGSAGRARYRLLETLSVFARARLIEAGEDEEVRRRHALNYLDLVDDSEHQFRGPGAEAWFDRLDEDHDNARSALAWALQANPELATRLATSWSWYRFGRGHLSEGRKSLATVLRDSNQVSKDVSIDALRAAGTLALFQGDLDDAGRLYEEAWLLQGEEATERSATILIGLGNVASDRSDWAAAGAFYLQALDIARQCGAVGRQAAALGNLGEIALRKHDLPAARSLTEQAIALDKQAGERKMGAVGLVILAHVAMEEGGIDEALSLLRAALEVFTQFRDPLFTANTIAAFGVLAATQQQPERALRLGGAGTALKEKIGSGDVFAPAKAWSEGHWALMRELLPPAAAEAAWESGKRMSLEEAVSYALSDL